MIQNYTQLWSVLMQSGVVLAILLFAYRKHILSVFDPLLYFIITQAFSIELGLLILDDYHFLMNFLGCQLSFLAGFFCFAGKPVTRKDMQTSRMLKDPDITQLSILKWYAVFGVGVLLLANMVQFKVNGIPIFSNDPSAAKVSSFSQGGGWGIVRRMDWGMLYPIGLILLFFYVYQKKFRYVLLLLLLLMIPALGGSKSALIYFIFLIAILGCFHDIRSNHVYKRLRVGNFFLLLFAIFLIVIIMFATNSAATFQDRIFGMVTKALFYGDAIIYYYDHSTIHYFAKYNFLTFLNDELNSVLGLMRIVPYSKPLGFRLIDAFMGGNSDTFGPNVPFYVKGNIYFGYYGAFVYSFFLGGTIGFTRNLFYRMIRKSTSSILMILLILHLNLIIFGIAQDSQLFISKLFDTVMLSLPIIIVVLYLHLSDSRQPAPA